MWVHSHPGHDSVKSLEKKEGDWTLLLLLSSYESQLIINSDLLSKSLTTLIRLLQGFHVVVLVLIMNYIVFLLWIIGLSMCHLSM